MQDVIRLNSCSPIETKGLPLLMDLVVSSTTKSELMIITSFVHAQLLGSTRFVDYVTVCQIHFIFIIRNAYEKIIGLVQELLSTVI